MPLRGTESVSCSVRHVTFSACWSILSSAVRFLSEPSMAVAAGQSIGQPTSRSSPSSSSSISHLHSAAGRLTLAASDFIGVFFSGWVLRPPLCSGRQVIAGVIYILRHFVRLCVYDRERCFRLTRLLLCSGAASSSEELWHQAINLSERCIRIDLVRDTAVDSGVASSRLSPHSTDKVKRIAEPLDVHFVHLFIDTSVQNVTDKNSDRWQLGMLVIPFFGKPDFCCWKPIWNQFSVLLTFIEI